MNLCNVVEGVVALNPVRNKKAELHPCSSSDLHRLGKALLELFIEWTLKFCSRSSSTSSPDLLQKPQGENTMTIIAV
jgi:hypothetical protein